MSAELPHDFKDIVVLWYNTDDGIWLSCKNPEHDPAGWDTNLGYTDTSVDAVIRAASAHLANPNQPGSQHAPV
jgi:hypothetical protein